MPPTFPVEMYYGCTYEKGKDIEDMMEVGEDWREWQEENDPLVEKIIMLGYLLPTLLALHYMEHQCGLVLPITGKTLLNPTLIG